MLYTGYKKTAADVLRVRIDMTDFVASVAPDPVTYTLHVQSGIGVAEVANNAGLIDIDVSGGVMGRYYLIGYEARTAGGDSDTETRRIRIVDASELAALPVVGPSSDIAVVTETGDELVTETGDAITWS